MTRHEDTPSEPPRRSVPRRTLLVRGGLIAVVGALMAGVLAVVAAYPPAEYGFYPRCASWTLFGIHCPGCGLTRAAHSLLTLDLPQAVAWNPFALVALPYLGIALLRSVWFWLWDIRSERSMLPEWLGWTVMVLMLVFVVLRNIPHEPFTLLAPHQIGG